MKFRRHGEGRQRIAGDDAGALPCLTVRMSAPRLYPPVLIAAVGIALFSLMDALMKHASIMIGAYSALLIRSLIGTLILLPFYRARQSEWPRGERLRIHILRGAVSCGMAFLFFHALTLLPIAEAIALSFIAPLIALYLAAATLGERIGRKAIIASLLGLIGVAAITVGRLHGDVTGWQSVEGIVSVLVSALLYAWNLVLQRRIAQIAPPAEVALSQHAMAALLLMLAAPWLLHLPDWGELGILALAAVLATISLMLLASAYGRAETHILVPMEYSGFLWAALFGWLFFAEKLTLPTLLGGVLIVIGCLIAAPGREPEQVAV